MQWLTTTHIRRWHAHRGTRGTGPVYQGRFKSFPIKEDGHLLTVCRYVERNPLRANLVEHAEDWPWCSLARRRQKGAASGWLIGTEEWSVWPPRNWQAVVNRPESEAEAEAVRRSGSRCQSGPLNTCRPKRDPAAGAVDLFVIACTDWHFRVAEPGGMEGAPGDRRGVDLSRLD